MITLAAPEITGLGETWLGVLAAAALAAALVTADGPLAAIVDALGGGRDASDELALGAFGDGHRGRCRRAVRSPPHAPPTC